MESFEPILEAMGYRYDKQTQLYKLDKETRLDAGFDDKIALIGCELLLAYEELNLFQEMTRDHNIDPLVHFSTLLGTPPHYKPTGTRYAPSPDSYHTQYGPDANPNPNPVNRGNITEGAGNIQGQQLDPYPILAGNNPPNQDEQIYPPRQAPNPNTHTQLANRTLPPIPGKHAEQNEQPEVDMMPRKPANYMAPQMGQTVDVAMSPSNLAYNQAPRNHKLDEIGIQQGMPTNMGIDPYRPAGVGDQRNASLQNLSNEPRGIHTRDAMDHHRNHLPEGQGGDGSNNPRYQLIHPGNQGINQAEQRAHGNPQNNQGMIPREIRRDVTGEQSYQGYPHGNPQDAGRDGMGGQGYQNFNQGINPQDGGRDGLGGQGYQNFNQGINPQDGGRDGLGGQGYQNFNQGISTQDGGRDGLGGQGYQNFNQGGINPQDGGRDGLGGQGYQNFNQGINPQGGGRDGLGVQGYPNIKEGINPQDGGRDGLGGQGYQNFNQGGINPQDGGRDGLGGQGYQNFNQGINPQDGGRDGLGVQGYPNIKEGINPQDRGRDGLGGQGYQNFNQGINPQDGGRDGLGGQGYQNFSQGINPQDGGRDGLRVQGYPNIKEGINPQDRGRDGLGGQGYQNFNQGGINPQDGGRNIIGDPGRVEHSSYGNPDGEADPKPLLGPKPTEIPTGGNAHPNPNNPDSNNPIENISPHHFERYQGKPLSIHSESPRDSSVALNTGDAAPIEDVQLPKQTLRDQQAKTSNDPSRNSGKFESQAFDKTTTTGLHETHVASTQLTYNPEKRISQEQQRYSGQQEQYSVKQEHYSGKQEHYSGQQEHYSGKQEHYSGQQEYYSGQQEHYSGQQEYYSGQPGMSNVQVTSYPRERQVLTRASEQNLVSYRVNSPPIQPLSKQLSENIPTEQRGAPMHQTPQQHQFEETAAPFRGNQEYYPQLEYVQNQPNYDKQGMYNNNYQAPYQEQNPAYNPPTDLSQGLQQMNLKGDIPQMQYQYRPQDSGHEQRTDYHSAQEPYAQREPPYEPYGPAPVHPYQATGELYHAPGHTRTNHPADITTPYMGIEPEENKATGQLNNHPTPDPVRYHEPYSGNIQRDLHMYEDENMPYPHPHGSHPDFSRPVGPNPNPRESPDHVGHRQYPDPQRPGPEAYNNNPQSYRGPTAYGQDQEMYAPNQDQYRQNPDLQRQFLPQHMQATEVPRQYSDPAKPYRSDEMEFPMRRDFDEKLRRFHEIDRYNEDKHLPFDDKHARFQQQPFPQPMQQQRVSDKPWNCPHCTFQNSATMKVCEMCAKTPDFLLGPNQAVPTHKKMCSTCKELNSVDARACYSCGRNFLPIT